MALPDLTLGTSIYAYPPGRIVKEPSKNGLDAGESRRYMQIIVRAMVERRRSLA